MKQNIQDKKGFTIIEVVLVLAIAGLIFLMVFIALPALQRNQRDSQRKNDIGRVQTAINSFQSNNRGVPPTDIQFTGGTFTAQYLTTGGDTFFDPSGANTATPAATTYAFNTALARGTVPAFTAANQNIIYIARASVCQGETAVAAGSRKIAVRVALEGGGNACVNN
jgi:prepilin-type N-terminal cleavage/methylation domain-containing protein